jgi:hypothetical protein
LKRQLAAIFLLSIFTFNLFGYRLLSLCVQNSIDNAMLIAIEKNKINEQDLISIKAPVNLSYYNNSTEFKRIDGEVKINGILYKYVKCRIFQDSLEMLCIPNHSKQQCQLATEQYSKAVNDIAQNRSDKKMPGSNKNSLIKKVVSEYEECEAWHLRPFVIEKDLLYSLVLLNPWKFLYLSSTEQPPDIFCDNNLLA